MQELTDMPMDCYSDVSSICLAFASRSCLLSDIDLSEAGVLLTVQEPYFRLNDGGLESESTEDGCLA